MPNVRDVRMRIKSVRNIQKITKAMEMVASARLRRAREKATASMPYVEKVRSILSNVTATATEVFHPLMEVRDVSRIGIVVLNADRGLAGAYTSNLIKEVLKQIKASEAHIKEAQAEGAHEEARFNTRLKREKNKVSKYSTDKKELAGTDYLDGANASVGDTNADVGMLVVGKKPRDYFKRRKYVIDREYLGFSDKPKYSDALLIASDIARGFIEGKYDEVYLCYTRFHSPAKVVPTTMKLLPVELPPKSQKMQEYIYAPDEGEVLNTLLPQYLDTMVYGALLQSAASELGSRMTAMEAATDNAVELVDKLTLFYNKARQAGITREITEIVGGVEALK